MEDERWEYLRPLSDGWLSKIQLASKHKQPFTDVADVCWQFFAGACGFMWAGDFQSKYFGKQMSPTFKVTIAKAFELVAIFGPVLYWKNPSRQVVLRKQLDLPPDLFQALGPMGEFLGQQYAQEKQVTSSTAVARNQLMEAWLNYTPTEQPGGLAKHSQLAITEALVKGRGCLWVEPYQMPGSQTTLTGCFWHSVDDLFIDPDATTMEDAKWIARRCVEPVWEVERKYGYAKDELKQYASLESANSQGERELDDLNRMHRATGETHDLMCYYKVWSKGGVGHRLSGVHTELGESFDRVVGDYAYVVVAPGVPWPLNAPRSHFDGEDGATDDEVAQMFAWPVPYWMDGRWPVAILDFYPKPNSVWPIAPMSPGLGELIFLNTMISHLANRIWSSTRDFIAVAEAAGQEITRAIKSGDDLTVIPLKQVQGKISEMVQFLQQPQVNLDAWRIVDFMMESFERRTGLNELLYGLNPGGVQSRTAADLNAKREMVSVRPDYMASQVEEWQNESADMEKICARMFVEAPDTAPLLGQVGSMLWTMLITDENPEAVFRDMKARVMAGETRRPNRERDTQNMQQVLPALFPELSKHADVTFDTGPLNNLIQRWGRTIEMDLSDVQMGQRSPAPPSPEQQQMMQAQMQAEQMKAQVDIQKGQADIAKAQIEVQKGQGELQREALKFNMDAQFDQQSHVQEIRQTEETHDQDLRHNEQAAKQELFLNMLKARQDAQVAEQKVQQQKEMGEIKAKQAKQQAKARPKPGSK